MHAQNWAGAPAISALEVQGLTDRPSLVPSSRRIRLNGFDWLRCYAIVAVVAIHVTDIALRKNDYFPTPTLEGAFYYGLSACLRFCVPVFFMMSAFLLETRPESSGRGLSAGWKRYAIPLLVASLVYTASAVATARATHKPVVFGELLIAGLTGHAAAHTWFLMSALVYLLLHSRLRAFAGPRAFPVLLGSYSLLFALTAGHPWLDDPNHFSSMLAQVVLGIPYYAAGIWAARHSAMLQRIPSRLLLVAVGIGTALSLYFGVVRHERGFFNVGAEVLSFALFVAALNVRVCAPPLALLIAKYSLGIYLWHLLVLHALHLAEGNLYRRAVSAAVTLALVILETGVALVVSLVAARFLARRGRLAALAT